MCNFIFIFRAFALLFWFQWHPPDRKVRIFSLTMGLLLLPLSLKGKMSFGLSIFPSNLPHTVLILPVLLGAFLGGSKVVVTNFINQWQNTPAAAGVRIHLGCSETWTRLCSLNGQRAFEMLISCYFLLIFRETPLVHSQCRRTLCVVPAPASDTWVGRAELQGDTERGKSCCSSAFPCCTFIGTKVLPAPPEKLGLS